MAKNYKEYNYHENRTEVVKVFEVLEGYLDYCRFELCEYDPSHYSVKGNHHPQFRAYLNSKRPRKPYQGNKPRWENNGRRNEQHFSR